MDDPSLDPRFIAGVDMLRRTGALTFDLRFQNDQEPTVWMAIVTHEVGEDGRPVKAGTGRPTWEVDAGHHPLEAVLRLCARMIDGGQCAHCHRPTAFMEDLTPTFGDTTLCWTQWDPELQTFRRSCEGDTN